MIGLHEEVVQEEAEGIFCDDLSGKLLKNRYCPGGEESRDRNDQHHEGVGENSLQGLASRPKAHRY